MAGSMLVEGRSNLVLLGMGERVGMLGVEARICEGIVGCVERGVRRRGMWIWWE